MTEIQAKITGTRGPFAQTNKISLIYYPFTHLEKYLCCYKMYFTAKETMACLIHLRISNKLMLRAIYFNLFSTTIILFYTKPWISHFCQLDNIKTSTV